MYQEAAWLASLAFKQAFKNEGVFWNIGCCARSFVSYSAVDESQGVARRL